MAGESIYPCRAVLSGDRGHHNFQWLNKQRTAGTQGPAQFPDAVKSAHMTSDLPLTGPFYHLAAISLDPRFDPEDSTYHEAFHSIERVQTEKKRAAAAACCRGSRLRRSGVPPSSYPWTAACRARPSACGA